MLSYDDCSIPVATPTRWTAAEFLAILDALPTPITWASHPDHTIRFVNRAFTATLGYRLEDLSTVSAWINEKITGRAQNERALSEWQAVPHDRPHLLAQVPPVEVDVRTRDGRALTMQVRSLFLPELGISVAVFEDIAEQKRAQNALRRMACEDVLTGVGNRRALQEAWHQLTDAAEGADEVTLMLIDLDGFKSVNDAWGHDAGDAVLKAATARLETILCPGATLFRTGGDEFALLIAATMPPQKVEDLYVRIQAAISAPISLGRETAMISASIGASRGLRRGASLRDMMHCADQALYDVKRRGKRGFAWCDGARAQARAPATAQAPSPSGERRGLRRFAVASAPNATERIAQDGMTLAPAGAA